MFNLLLTETIIIKDNNPDIVLIIILFGILLFFFLVGMEVITRINHKKKLKKLNEIIQKAEDEDR